MKQIITIIFVIFSVTNIFSQNLSKNSVTDKDYITLINYYLKTNEDIIKYNYDTNQASYLVPNGKFLSENEIIKLYGKDYFNSIYRISYKELPYFHKYGLKEYCNIETYATFDKKRLITGCAITVTSLTLYCITNSAINHRLSNCTNPTEYSDLNKAKYISGYIYGAGALAGIIVSLTSIHTTIKIDKNYQFDINGALVQFSHKF